MKIEKTYSFNEREYEKDGRSIIDGCLFIEKIQEFERDFYCDYPFTPANYLYMHPLTMNILAECYIADEEGDKADEIYGMDSIYDDMEANFNANHKMDLVSSKVLVYAISTAIDDDEPLFLIRDASQRRGSLSLKYISDNKNGGEGDFVEVPIGLVSVGVDSL